ncbi:hypothetical protein QR685DRAFT_69517 [Neurospora intermedia]|uniref:Uncharacterized protein n=1 Tax=Neurospora intermedia TaxID=5142 RepID=A0ABR3DTX4_NEUIN
MERSPPPSTETKPLDTPTPIQTAQANNMVYTDDKGIKHSIYLPQGTLRRASEYLQNKRWDDLAKFEPYTNQGYTEDDFRVFREMNINQGQEE